MDPIQKEADVGGFFSKYGMWFLGAFGVLFTCVCTGLIGSGEIRFSDSTTSPSTTPAPEHEVDESMKNEDWFPRYKRAYENQNFEKAGRIFCENNPGVCK